MSPVLHPVEPSADDGGRSDAELLAAHTVGDRYAFEHLIRRHERRLWAVALRTMRNPEDASDAIQDAFVSAYRAAASYRGEAALSSWLHRIVVNACLDRLRRARPTSELPDDDALGQPPAPDEMDRLDERLRLQAALVALPEGQRLAVLLVDVEGFSVAEAAESLGVAAGTVKSRCARGRVALATWLRETEPTDDPSRPNHVNPRRSRPRASQEGGL